MPNSHKFAELFLININLILIFDKQEVSKMSFTYCKLLQLTSFCRSWNTSKLCSTNKSALFISGKAKSIIAPTVIPHVKIENELGSEKLKAMTLNLQLRKVNNSNLNLSKIYEDVKQLELIYEDIARLEASRKQVTDDFQTAGVSDEKSKEAIKEKVRSLKQKIKGLRSLIQRFRRIL